MTQTPPSGEYVGSGVFSSTAVDFPGLDPASDSNEFNFMHQSEVVQGEPVIVQVEPVVQDEPVVVQEEPALVQSGSKLCKVLEEC